MTAKKADSAAVRVRILTENHEHRGSLVPPGSVIEVDERDAQWLIRDGVAEAEKEK